MPRRLPLALVLALAFASGCKPGSGATDGGTDGGVGNQCTAANAAQKCNDGDPCTTDACDGGYCVWGRPQPAMKQIATIKTAGTAGGIYYPTHSRLQVASGDAGIETFDLSGLPDGGVTRTQIRPTAQPAIDVNEASDALIAVEGLGGLEVFPRTGTNLTTPLGTYLGSDRIVGVGRTQTYVVAYTYGKGLEILDASDWTNLTRLSRADTAGRAYDAVLWNDKILVADGLAGIDEVDFSDPTAAKVVDGFDLPTEGRARAIARRGNLVTLAEDGAGMGVFDLGAKGGPARIATLTLPGPAMDVDMFSSRTILVADGSGGLVVADLLDKTKPQVWIHQALPGPAVSVAHQGQTVAVSMGAKGVAVFDLACPTK